MKESRRSKRMKRHHARAKSKNTALNMVSLMDIFTILVFFLLVSAASSDILPTPKNIKLPRSTAEALPKENVVIVVGDGDILVQGKKVAEVQSLLKSKDLMIMDLYEVLKRHYSENNKSKGSEPEAAGVTIMGDKEVPYVVLKKIMLTCSAAKFTDISFAVTRKLPENV